MSLILYIFESRAPTVLVVALLLRDKSMNVLTSVLFGQL